MSSGFNSGAIDPALLITTTHPNHNNTSTTTNSQPSTSTSTSTSNSTSTSTSTTINPSQLNLNPRSSTVDPSHPDHHHHHHHHHLLLPLRSQPSNPTSGAGALINSSLVFPLTSSTIDQPSSSLPPTHPNPNSSSSSLGPPSSSSLPLHHHHHPPPPTPSSLNLPPSQSSIPPTIPSNSDPTLLNGSTTPTQSNLPNLRDETSSNQEQEMHQKDQELAQFLLRMEDYKPVIPDRVAAYYLSKVGFESTDLNVQRLLVLACQKFISDIAQDAFSYARTRTGQAPGSRQGPLAPLSNSAGLSTALPNHPGTRKDRTRTVLTQEDLAQALAEYGINASRAPYYL